MRQRPDPGRHQARQREEEKAPRCSGRAEGPGEIRGQGLQAGDHGQLCADGAEGAADPGHQQRKGPGFDHRALLSGRHHAPAGGDGHGAGDHAGHVPLELRQHSRPREQLRQEVCAASAGQRSQGHQILRKAGHPALLPQHEHRPADGRAAAQDQRRALPGAGGAHHAVQPAAGPGHRLLSEPVAGQLQPGAGGHLHPDAGRREILRPEHGRHGAAGAEQEKAAQGRAADRPAAAEAAGRAPEGQLAGVPGGRPRHRLCGLPVLSQPHEAAPPALPALHAAVPEDLQAAAARPGSQLQGRGRHIKPGRRPETRRLRAGAAAILRTAGQAEDQKRGERSGEA